MNAGWKRPRLTAAATDAVMPKTTMSVATVTTLEHEPFGEGPPLG